MRRQYARSAPVLVPYRKGAHTTPVLSTPGKCALTSDRYISRSFVDDPFQGSKYLLLYPIFLGKASRQLTLFAPACSSFQASPTLVIAIPYIRLLARHTYRGTINQLTSIHRQPLVIVAWPCEHSPSTGHQHPRPYWGLVVTASPKIGQTRIGYTTLLTTSALSRPVPGRV